MHSLKFCEFDIAWSVRCPCLFSKTTWRRLKHYKALAGCVRILDLALVHCCSYFVIRRHRMKEIRTIATIAWSDSQYVFLSVWHALAPCKDGWTDRSAVCSGDFWGHIVLHQSCPWVHFVWPDPTQPISWLTQPNSTHYKWKKLDPTRPNSLQLTTELTV